MSINCAEGFGFKLEGILKEHKYSSGSFVDLKIYSITREVFLSSKFVKTINN